MEMEKEWWGKEVHRRKGGRRNWLVCEISEKECYLNVKKIILKEVRSKQQEWNI